MLVKSNDKNFHAIVKKALEFSQLPVWQPEIKKLPSGKIGFIYIAIEDALGDLGGYLKFDGETFIYDGPPIPDYLV